MKPNRFLPGLIAWIFLFSTACQPSVAAKDIPLTTANVLGQVEVQIAGRGDFAPISDKVGRGDRIRVQAGGSVELRDARTSLRLGSGTQAVVESLSADAAVTHTRMNLEKGFVYAEAQQPLTPGQVEVLTPGGSASIQGSGMLVSLSPAMMTIVGCTAGSASVTAAGATQSLAAGEATTFISGGVPSRPLTLDEELFGDDPLMLEAIKGVINPPKLITETPLPIQPEPTANPSATITRTPAPTWTEMVLGPTATVRVDSALPTRRPTATQDPDLKGLTPEEAANQGEHTYSVGCQAWGECVCDSALAVPEISMTIAFDSSGVSLSASEGQLSYPRAAPNLYRIEQPDLLAEITFLPEGWELFVLKGSNACALQTYTRQ